MTKDFRPRSFKQTQSGVSTLNYITPSAALNSGVSSTFSNDVQTMSKLIELAAPIAFFTCWVMTDDIFLSTQVLMVMISFQAIIEYASTKTLKPMTKLLLVSVLIFGGLTIAFRDETFILWKPTIVNWALGLLLAGSQFLLRRPVLGSLMGTQIQLPDPVWFKLGYGWAIGFFIAGCVNLVVAFQFSLDFWMTYKLIGGPALIFVYIIITMVYLNRSGVSIEQPVQKSGD